jgi:3-methyladenine DNA glycosylase AlkC
MSEILTVILSSVATGGVGGFFGWLFGRRKYNEEVKGSKVQNFDAALDAYKKMYEDMIGDLKNNLEDVKKENGELKAELAENRKQIMTLTNFVLASAIKRADGDLDAEAIEKLRQMI